MDGVTPLKKPRIYPGWHVAVTFSCFIMDMHHLRGDWMARPEDLVICSRDYAVSLFSFTLMMSIGLPTATATTEAKLPATALLTDLIHNRSLSLIRHSLFCSIFLNLKIICVASIVA